MNRRLAILLFVFLVVTVTSLTPGAKADTPVYSLPTDSQVSFQLTTAGQGVGICLTVTTQTSISTATFNLDKQTGNLAGATVQGFIDTISTGSPTGNNCSDNGNLATTASADVSQLPLVGTCPCAPAVVTTIFSPAVSLGPNQIVIIGVKVNANPNGGTVNVFGNAQTSAIMSDICYNSVPGCSGNFAVCNFVDNCIGWAVFTPSQPSTPPPSQPAPPASSATVYTPIGAPVGQQAITPTFQQTPGPFVDSLPIVYIAAILFTLTLGAYFVTSKDATKKLKQYELRV